MGIEETIGGLGHLINGEIVRGSDTFDVTNPATGKVFAQCPAATTDDVEAAMAAAAAAQPKWAEDLEFRRETIRQMAQVIQDNFPTIDEISSLEKGQAGAGGEAFFGSFWGQAVAEHEIPVDVLKDDDDKRIEVHRKPVGVISCIAPWNAPILILGEEIFGSLLLGNTVVGKPSPFTPLATLYVASLWKDIVPPGVVNILAGGDEIGAAMTAHPTCRAVAFTGSVAAGKAIAAATAHKLTNLVFELGGNDAAIVLEDVDVPDVAMKIFGSAMGGTGQICAAVKRAYVHESIYEEFVAQLAEHARATVAAPSEEGGTMGPLGTRPQYERVIELVEDALENGAKAVTGGAPEDREGFFYPPTILTGIGAGVRVVDEEQFGPILPVIPFSDVDWAIEQANATEYGLCGSIWTKDLEKGRKLADRLDCGTSSVNQHVEVDPGVPFGGFKCSGMGRVAGKPGIDAYAELQTRITLKT